jgi:NDP-sugar pyrophosphorylase family protein
MPPADLAAVAALQQGALAKVVADPRLYGIFEVDAYHRVLRLVEKPVEVFSNLANIGAYKFTPEVFEVLRRTPLSERGEIEITSAIQTLADEGAFHVVESQGYWLPIGYPWHLLDANAYLLDTQLHAENLGQVQPGAHIQGGCPHWTRHGDSAGRGDRRPRADWRRLRDWSQLLDPSSVTLGNGCKVGQGSEIKNSILFDRAKAPHLNYVGDSVIGEGANLGCGTVISNLRHDNASQRSMVKGALVDTGRRKLGAILGDGVHTGINTSIYPGRKLWPGTTTAPCEIVKADKEA